MAAKLKTRITELFNIDYPVIQGGMAWVSGWKLAAAVSNAGGLGLISGASMSPELLEEHINKINGACNKPYGVNIVLADGHAEDAINVCLKKSVKIIFTAAGSPKKHISSLKEAGIKVVHVVPSVKLALKVEDAGCDAVVAEGVESGGHAGFEEITSLCLWPSVVDAVNIPVIAAGGIIDGRGLAAAISLGADGVQVGSRFAVSSESSANIEYKQAVLKAGEADAKLYFRNYIPTRSLANKFVKRALEAERSGAEISELEKIRGKFRSKNGILNGDMDEGDLEIGQVAGRINEISSAGEIVTQIVEEYNSVVKKMVNEL